MLVLSRKAGESILIGDTEVHVLKINGRVRIGVIAASDVPIRRGEMDDPGQPAGPEAPDESPGPIALRPAA